MLETGQYYGIWQMSQVESQSTKEDTNHKQSSRTLCAVAGIHVYSATRKVAALGNITTHPLYRKQGYARIAITALVLSLFDGGVERIGLNVKADNVQAISLYESLGFVKIGRYEENMIYQN
jgi:ribosomal protein S18 acetylase RimI-like enzyme